MYDPSSIYWLHTRLESHLQGAAGIVSHVGPYRQYCVAVVCNHLKLSPTPHCCKLCIKFKTISQLLVYNPTYVLCSCLYRYHQNASGRVAAKEDDSVYIRGVVFSIRFEV